MAWKDWGSNARQPAPSPRYRLRAALPSAIIGAILFLFAWHGHSWQAGLASLVVVFLSPLAVDYFITYRRYRN